MKVGDRVVTVYSLNSKTVLTVSEIYGTWGFHAVESDQTWNKSFSRPLWHFEYFIKEEIYNSPLYQALK